MKKTLLSISLCFGLYFFSLTIAIDQTGNTTPWRENFKNINHKELTKALGYNPQLRLIQDNNPTTQHKCVTVYFHGWLAAGNADTVLKRIEKIPGDKIIFNFKDASSWYEVPQCITKLTGIKSIPYWIPRIWNSSLAQEGEIIDALTILNTLHKNQITKFVLYGQSRGGAVATTIPGFLNHHTKNNKNYKSILESITLVHIDTPLKNVKTALKVHPFARILGFIGLTKHLESTIVPKLSLYRPNKHAPIDWIEYWPENLPVTYFPQHNDNKVGNEDDHLFANELLKKSKNAIICPLNDGGHDSGIHSIQHLIHGINQQYGGSYDTKKTKAKNHKTFQCNDHTSVEQFLQIIMTNAKKRL